MKLVTTGLGSTALDACWFLAHWIILKTGFIRTVLIYYTNIEANILFHFKRLSTYQVWYNSVALQLLLLVFLLVPYFLLIFCQCLDRDTSLLSPAPLQLSFPSTAKRNVYTYLKLSVLIFKNHFTNETTSEVSMLSFTAHIPRGSLLYQRVLYHGTNGSQFCQSLEDLLIR